MQTMLGATGSGKTFTMANIIAQHQRPTLVLAPNRTLAAQLTSEFRDFFPRNAVEYFVSYYDYYQPEAYVPRSDTYIAKDADINEEIDKMRHSATRALFEHRDVLIVASVSCIYGLGEPGEYESFVAKLHVGRHVNRNSLIRQLIDMQYARNDMSLVRGTFRVRGDTLTIFPAYEDLAVRVDFWGDEIERIVTVDPLSGELLTAQERFSIYPAKHFVTSSDRLEVAITNIEEELRERSVALRREGRILEATRLEERTRYDLEMLRESGYCSGIENYSRHLQGRAEGSTPWTLLDYFPDDWLVFIDESHIAVPQIRGMYFGDIRRKETLGRLRLPVALGARQSPAQLRRVRGSPQPGDLRLRDARPVRAGALAAGRRAGDPPDRPPRSDRRGARDARADRRPARRGAHAGGAPRARAGDDADQEDGRGPDRLPDRDGREGAVPPLRDRHPRARRHPPRPAPGRVRRARRYQPAARGPRPARGLAGLHPRRRQGGLPALRRVTDPDESAAPPATPGAA